MATQPDLLADAPVGTVTDLMRVLAAAFPRHRDELAGWAASYRRQLGHLNPHQLRTTVETTLDAWTLTRPPRPVEFRAAAATTTSSTATLAPGALTYTEHGRRYLTRTGLQRARDRVEPITAAAMHHAPADLPERTRLILAAIIRERAWLAAQHEALTDTRADLAPTADDIQRARDIADTRERLRSTGAFEPIGHIRPRARPDPAAEARRAASQATAEPEPAEPDL